MIRYLSGCSGSYLEDVAHEHSIGLLIQPRNGYTERVDRFPLWGADNGAFSVASKFDPELFRRMLRHPHALAHRGTCQFVAAPDCLVVHADGTVTGDALGTLQQFPSWSAEIRALGYPVALVAQDGLETMLDDVPWAELDCLFLGGSTEWKIGPARACIEAAQRHDKRTHMGRVNSLKRLRLANSWGIDTADGTFLGFGPKVNLPRLLNWLRALREEEYEWLCTWLEELTGFPIPLRGIGESMPRVDSPRLWTRCGEIIAA